MNYQIIQQNLTASTYPSRGITLIRGKGSTLFDENAKAYIDMLGGSYGVGILGYSIRSITAKIQDQIEKLMIVHSSSPNDKRSQSTYTLIQFTHRAGFLNLKRIFWSNSGTEAIEAALKFAIIHTNKHRFIAAKGGYHGKTLGALSINNSGDGKYQEPFKNVLLPVDLVEFGNIRALEQVITSNHAGVILEPIQGEGGVIVPPLDYLTQVHELCKKNNVLLIIDEIQTGMGRTGTFFNSQRYIQSGFGCDILCLGKGLGYGLPVGATLISEKINMSLTKGIHTSTFGGNPLSMTGVYETLMYLEKHASLIQNATNKGLYIQSKLKKIQRKYSTITDISGVGLMIGVGLSVNPITVLKIMQDKGVLAAPTSGDRIRFLPALTIAMNEIDIALKIFEEAVCEAVTHNV